MKFVIIKNQTFVTQKKGQTQIVRFNTNFYQVSLRYL